MPEDNTSEVKCEKCDCVINDDVFSNSEHDALCLSCFEDYASCNDCSESCDTSDEGVIEHHGHYYCEDCASCNFSSCEQTGNRIHLERDEIYEWEGWVYSASGAEDATGYECTNCGHCVSVRESCENEGEDHVYNEQCYNCWENQQNTRMLADEPLRGIKRSIILDKRYFALYGTHESPLKGQARSAGTWLNSFYGHRLENYGHNNIMIKKGGDPEKRDNYSWWHSTMKIRSNLNEEIETWLKRFIQEDDLKVPHKKLGTYHPFRDFFGAYLECSLENIVTDDEGVETEKYRSQYSGYPGEDVSYYIETMHSRALRQTIDNNRLRIRGQVGKLRLVKMKGALNKIITKNYELLEKIYPDRIKTFKLSWEKYLTNSVYLEVPVKIGFDPAIQSDIEQFNYDVNSCQSSRYVDTLAHGFADMLVNPHLYLLIMSPSDPERIIGRSVLRVWRKPHPDKKSNEDFEGDTRFIAPSRLYLSQYTHAKNEIYANVFAAADEWAKKMFDEHILVAYGKSRHDACSPAEYIKNSTLVKPIIRDGLQHYNRRQRDEEYNSNPLVTDWWYPFWQGAPSEEGDYIYYNDEYQRSEMVFCHGTDVSQDIAVREKIGDFVAVEVRIEQ